MLTIPRTVAALLVTLILSSCSLFSEEAGEGARPAPPVPAVLAPPTPPLGAVEASFFGMHDHDPVGDGPSGWPAAPVGSLRAWDAGVLWRDIEVSPGVYNFDRLDAIVDTAERHGSDVLVVLGQTPPFHALRPNTRSFYGPGAASVPRLEAWTAYVRAVAERYAGRPVSLQIWNEANVKGFWKGTPAQMAALTKAAYDVLETVNPRPTLVAPAFVTRLIGQRAWFDSFYGERVDGAPIADFVDVVSLQLYPDSEGTPESAMDLLVAARVTLDKYGVTKPIWNTEVNYGLTGLPVDPAPVEEQQANVARTYLLNAAAGVDRVYWYGWDQQQIVDTLLTETDAATVTPAGRAFATVQSWVVGGVIDACPVDAAGTYTCTLRRSDGVRRVYWNYGRWATVTLPAGVTTYQELNGVAVGANGEGSVKIGSSPVMVSSRS